MREFARAMYVCVDTRSKSVLSQGKFPLTRDVARIESVRGDEPEVSLVRWLRFQCTCHGCKAGSVSWHAHLVVLCERVGSPRSSHTVKVTELYAIFLIILILPALSLCPGKVPLITLVKTTSAVGNLHNIRY